MAFWITPLDTGPLERKFEELATRISRLPVEMRHVAMDWQREDMKRRFPHLAVEGDNTVVMTIYPRSRTWVRRKGGGGGRARPRRRAIRRVGSTRPILRPALLQMLHQRMLNMCEDALKWR